MEVVVAVSMTLRDGVADGVAEPTVVTLAATDADHVVVPDELAVSEAETVLVIASVALELAVGADVSLVVGNSDAETLTVAWDDALAPDVPDGDAVAVKDTVPLVVISGDPVGDNDAEEDAVELPLALAVAVVVSDGADDDEGEGVPDSVDATDSLARGDAELETLTDVDALDDAVDVTVAVAVLVVLAVTVGDAEVEAVWDAVLVTDAVTVALRV